MFKIIQIILKLWDRCWEISLDRDISLNFLNVLIFHTAYFSCLESHTYKNSRFIPKFVQYQNSQIRVNHKMKNYTFEFPPIFQSNRACPTSDAPSAKTTKKLIDPVTLRHGPDHTRSSRHVIIMLFGLVNGKDRKRERNGHSRRAKGTLRSSRTSHGRRTRYYVSVDVPPPRRGLTTTEKAAESLSLARFWIIIERMKECVCLLFNTCPPLVWAF